MMQAWFSAASGLVGQQRRLDVIGNNIANVNTVGYKSVRQNFKDALYSAQQRVVGLPIDNNLQMGHGVIPHSTSRMFSEGNFQNTGVATDFALSAEGFFTLENPITGSLVFSRTGSFSLSVENNGNYLVDANGYYILDSNSQRINVPNGYDLKVGQNGQITYHSKFDDTIIETNNRMAIVRFNNRHGLESVGNQNFVATLASGNPILDNETEVRQGALEGSNVDLAQEMTRMIRTQKAYSLASRALKTADDMEGDANSIRR